MFVELSLNIGGKAKESSHFGQSSHAVSMIPADSILIQQYFFLSGVYREFGMKVMEIKVAEINVPLNKEENPGGYSIPSKGYPPGPRATLL